MSLNGSSVFSPSLTVTLIGGFVGSLYLPGSLFLGLAPGFSSRGGNQVINTAYSPGGAPTPCVDSGGRPRAAELDVFFSSGRENNFRTFRRLILEGDASLHWIQLHG